MHVGRVRVAGTSRTPPAGWRLGGASPRRVVARCSAAQQRPSDIADARIRQRELEQQLAAAVQSEDYTAAAWLKKEIDTLSQQDPLAVLAAELQCAVEEERYQDAARLRDQLRELEEAAALQAAASQPTSRGSGGARVGGEGQEGVEEVASSSDTTTAGIRVQVQSYYAPANSLPALSQYFFMYRITITNNSKRVVQLLSRHWLIKDTGTGRVDHVRGPGVVGEQPVLPPGQHHTYESACPLRSTHGTMEGEYEFAVLNPASDDWVGERLEVRVGRFGLSTKGPTLSS